MVYLLGNRDCNTDQIADLAWAAFGQGSTGWERVRAIRGHVHGQILFARVRDAADIAIASIFGMCIRVGFTAETDELPL